DTLSAVTKFQGPPALACPILIVYHYGLQRDRHSFPTRRSSDLWWSRSWAITRLLVHRDFGEAAWRRDVQVVGNGVAGDLREQFRSEEHTSELQSREKLVCRLLLEKKKRIIKKW